MTISNISYNFKAGEISSEAGSLCLAKYINHIGLKESLEGILGGNPEQQGAGAPVQYSRGELASHYVLGIMQGYQTPAEMDRAKDDPVMRELTGQKPSASGFSRLLTSFGTDDLQELRNINQP